MHYLLGATQRGGRDAGGIAQRLIWRRWALSGDDMPAGCSRVPPGVAPAARRAVALLFALPLLGSTPNPSGGRKGFARSLLRRAAGA